MTQQEKQLLLKDLCARFPYGVICKLSTKDTDVSITEKLELGGLEHFISGTMDVKPHLRPMSSMSSDEKMEWFQMRQKHCNMSGFNELQERAEFTSESSDWLNAHHFDYRGLIEKGLALEAPEGMYKTE